MSSIIQDAEEMISREINKVSHQTGRELTEYVDNQSWLAALFTALGLHKKIELIWV